MSLFLYKFVPHRPDFPATMTDTEAAVMGAHVAYWQALADKDITVAFGPVADPGGSWGVAIVEAATEDEVHAIRAADPVVTSDLGPVCIYPMPNAITRRS
ncbi:YciI family protein [Acrocarpospora sp. B8E8]|uniref:YciI family protein n=1 Tax=Acrocarpospora sp. B8E8 TaxID=3153572 RepID=UPI00325F36D5